MAWMKLFIKLVAIMIVTNGTNALICYENDDYGKIYETSNESVEYCVFIPDDEDGRVFGVGKETDITEGFDGAFGKSDKVYQVLTLCILEKFDYGQMNTRGTPNLPAPVEFAFRCICNYDRCNRATTFSNYLAMIKMDNAKSSADKSFKVTL